LTLKDKDIETLTEKINDQKKENNTIQNQADLSY
jgi:hypothetical protein